MKSINGTKIKLFILLGLFVQSCKTIKISDFESTQRLQNPIPLLEAYFDYASIEKAYVYGTRNYVRSVWVEDVYFDSPIIRISNFVERELFVDSRFYDAVIMFEKELNDNICTYMGQPLGKAIFRINNLQSSTTGYGFFALSILTLSVPNWFGMPFYKYLTEVELELEIRDCDDKTIGRFTGVGSKKIPVAAWHGYWGRNVQYIFGNEDAARKSNLEAIKLAMNEIKNKIERNALVISRDLERCR